MGSVFVTPYQNKNTKSAAYGKWYFRIFHTQTIVDSDLEDYIAADSKIERSKVGVIDDAITKQIEELLCNGHPIRIPHLGLIKVSVNSEGADTVSEFNAGKAIKNVHLVFTPDKKIKAALRELKFEKFYYVMKPADEPEP